MRFGTSRGWCEPGIADRLSVRTELAFVPRGWDRGERTGRPVVNRRVVRRRRVERPPSTLTVEEIGTLVDVCSNMRDRFVVEALYATGLRVAELCGLHLSDLHLVPAATHLGCRLPARTCTSCVVRTMKTGRSPSRSGRELIPVTKSLVLCHDAYRFERDVVPEAAESDYLLVNLRRAPVGRALSPDAVERLFVRLSARVGFRARPHMLRHSFASRDRARDEGPGAGEGTAGARLGQLHRRLPTREVGRHACGSGGTCRFQRRHHLTGALKAAIAVAAVLDRGGRLAYRTPRITHG